MKHFGQDLPGFSKLGRSAILNLKRLENDFRTGEVLGNDLGDSVWISWSDKDRMGAMGC